MKSDALHRIENIREDWKDFEITINESKSYERTMEECAYYQTTTLMQIAIALNELIIQREES